MSEPLNPIDPKMLQLMQQIHKHEERNKAARGGLSEREYRFQVEIADLAKRVGPA